MVVVLFLLALSLIGTGGSAVLFGAPIIQVERGYTMVIAGTIAVCSGLLLLGVALAAHRLGRVVQELTRVRDRLHQIEMSAPYGPATPSPTSEDVPARGPDKVQQSGPPTIVGQYSSGGNSYVMYSDGSIHADTPTGQHRFGSLDELRAFVAAGGERAEA